MITVTVRAAYERQRISRVASRMVGVLLRGADNGWVARQQRDVLANLEQDLLDRTVPLADSLLTCRTLAEKTGAAQLLQWATAELEGYQPLNSVPAYRRVAAPILWSVDVPYRGIVTQPFNVQSLPQNVRELLNEPVPLNQSVDELEALDSQYEAQNKPVQLEVFCSDLLMAIWNKNNPRGPCVVALTWSIDPPIIRGVLGQVRTKLHKFVSELRDEVGDSDELPSAVQTDEALRAVVPWAVINNSTVTIVTATTKNGDIMPDAPRTTIKGNKTKIKGSSGNVSVASAGVAQVSGDGIDVAKIREFTDLLTQIAPTLGLAAAQQDELHFGTEDLQQAASSPSPEKGRIRQAVGRVLQVLRVAAPSAAQKIAISMGDELIRELGEEVARSLPH